MKVCFISPHVYPLFNEEYKFNFGGAEVQLYLIAKELAKDTSYETHFITADFGQSKFEIKESVILHKSFPLELFVQKKAHYLNFKKIVKTIKFVFAILKVNADIYIQRTAGAETGITAFLCCLMKKKFIFMTGHDMDCNTEYIKNNGLRGLMFSFGIKRANLIITQSKHHKDMLFRFHGIKSTIINNVFNIEEKYIDNKEYILWVGRIISWKQPELFLKITERFKNEKFVIVAPQSCTNEEYQSFVTELDNIKNIKYIKYVPFSKIDKYFKKAKVLINTSLHEGFPNTFIQAFKNCTPILTLGVNPDGIIEKYKLGICSKTFEEMVNNLNILLKNETYKNYAENCYSYAKDNNNIKSVIVDFKNIIKN